MNARHTLLDHSVASAIIAQGYSLIPFSPPAGLIASIFEGWRSYLRLPFEKKILWRVGNPLDWDDGFVCRDGSEGKDWKSFFHFRPHLTALLEHVGTDYQGFVGWLSMLDQLWQFCHDHFGQVIEELDCEYPQFDLLERFFHLAARNRHVIRLLDYSTPFTPGMPLGKRHEDRNFGTFHVAETHRGLVLELPDSSSFDYRAEPGKVLFFTGSKANRLTGGELHAVQHSIAVPKDCSPSATSRQSIVFFGHVFFEESKDSASK